MYLPELRVKQFHLFQISIFGSIVLLVLLGSVVAQYEEEPEEPEEEEDEPKFTHGQLIRSYCHLVKESKFYKTYGLKENCALKVRKFGSKVLFLHKHENVHNYFNDIC